MLGKDKGPIDLLGYADSDWGGDRFDRKSYTVNVNKQKDKQQQQQGKLLVNQNSLSTHRNQFFLGSSHLLFRCWRILEQHPLLIYMDLIIHLIVFIMKETLRLMELVAELSDRFDVKVKFKDIFALFRYHEYLKGIINCFNEDEPMRKYSAKLEMISSRRIEPSVIRIGSSTFGVIKVVMISKRVHIISQILKDYMLRLKVTIDIFSQEMFTHENISFIPRQLRWSSIGKFMDACPNLLSAHIYSGMVYLFTGEISIHKCLQDLVIEFLRPLENLHDFKRLFMKYPNLKHLRLKMKENTKDEHIEQLVHILPNLVLLDVTECPGVTQRAADYVTDYCKRYGRPIKFYFNGNIPEMDSLWPDLYIKREKIGRAFDFMKHCFLKDFYHLPYFLIPIDY
uniref:Uncharacterized protein n=1 Tax=Tetranychus urticae TaxID=32264 RepID=T1K8R9_TETUR